MIDDPDFPRLTPENHRITSPASADYNCIAWSAEDTKRWWQPGVYWPIPVLPDEYGIEILEQAFLSLGYEVCPDRSLQIGFQKVALYRLGSLYTHAARQLEDGTWTSKLGRGEDIVHNTPGDVAGGVYGEVAEFMRRPIAKV
jgi:hypothetical protein